MTHDHALRNLPHPFDLPDDRTGHGIRGAEARRCATAARVVDGGRMNAHAPDRVDIATGAAQCLLRAAPASRSLLVALAIAMSFAGCTTTPPSTTPTATVPPPAPEAAVTRGEFTLVADKLDTWNAIGQLIVRTAGVDYEGRAQMLDLYSVRYRGQAFLLITHALTLSDTIRDSTTRVTATTLAGKPIDTPASADLLAQLQRELPDEIVRVRAQQAAERAAAAKHGKAAKSKKKRRK